MRRYLILALAFFAAFPFSCYKCGDEAFNLIPNSLDLGFGGTAVTGDPGQYPPNSYLIDSNFYISALIDGEMEYIVEQQNPLFDGGLVFARDECMPPRSYGFKPGVDSIVIRANKPVFTFPAGASLNTLFTFGQDHRYQYNMRRLNVVNEQFQSGEHNLASYISSSTSDFQASFQPDPQVFKGTYTFTVEFYFKDGSSLVDTTESLTLF